MCLNPSITFGNSLMVDFIFFQMLLVAEKSLELENLSMLRLKKILKREWFKFKVN